VLRDQLLNRRRDRHKPCERGGDSPTRQEITFAFVVSRATVGA
jgi:hypothetical protein